MMKAARQAWIKNEVLRTWYSLNDAIKDLTVEDLEYALEVETHRSPIRKQFPLRIQSRLNRLKGRAGLEAVRA